MIVLEPLIEKDYEKMMKIRNLEENCIVRINIKNFKDIEQYEHDGREHAIYGVLMAPSWTGFTNKKTKIEEKWYRIRVRPLNFCLDEDYELREYQISGIKNPGKHFLTRLDKYELGRLLDTKGHWFL